MGYTDEGSNRFSFFSFVLSILGFFFLSFYGIGAIVGIIAVVLSFLAEDILKEKSTFQYLAIIVAVVDILGAIVGWSIIVKA
jgi:hypothetical protein